MLLSPPTFTSTHFHTGAIVAPSSKRRCINPVLSASRALQAITSTTPADSLPMIFGAPLQMPLSPPMEGTASLPRRRALRRKQVEDQEKGAKRKRTASNDKKVYIEVEEAKTKKPEEKKPRALFMTPEQTTLPTEIPRGLTRTVFAQAFDSSRPRVFTPQDDAALIALVARSLAATATSQSPQTTNDDYTTTPSTPPSNSRKRRRED